MKLKPVPGNATGLFSVIPLNVIDYKSLFHSEHVITTKHKYQPKMLNITHDN